MHILQATVLAGGLTAGLCFCQNSSDYPRWWPKYQYLLNNGPSVSGGGGGSILVGPNVDVSHECGPQSETFVSINPAKPNQIAGGSNEIFRLPMRGYASADSGSTWTGADLPLPPAIGTHGIDFGSDPSLAFDTQGNLYYSYIVVFYSHGNGINGTEMAVARSTDGGKTYPQATFFNFSSGSNHFNDKPMIAADTNALSPYRDNVYIAWDAASGGSSGGGVLVARSSDHGNSFSVTRVDNPNGPGRSIGAVPFVGPNGEVYVAWNDYSANSIVFNRSLDGGASWGTPVTIALKTIAFDAGIPAESFRRALVYPACDADRSGGSRGGTLYCSWMDAGARGTDIFVSSSKDRGATWTPPSAVADQLTVAIDRFNQWLAVDPTNGDVNLSFYDTRNDTTGSRYQADIYFTHLGAKATTWSSPNLRVSSASSNEHDCNGTYPCTAIDYGNQYGDYSGLASYGGLSFPMWTDSRRDQDAAPGCRTGLAMEEVFTALVK